MLPGIYSELEWLRRIRGLFDNERESIIDRNDHAVPDVSL